MWLQRAAYILAIGCACCPTLGVVHANAEADPWSNPDAVCNGQPPPSLDYLYRERLGAVFAVRVTNVDGTSKPTGTATLIDERGIFLTAAHAVHFNEQFPITVTQKFTGQSGGIVERKYQVSVITNTDDFLKQDVALLRVLPLDWDTPGIVPVPLRIDAVGRPIKGFFIGHAEGLDRTVYEDFSIAFDEEQTIHRGNVFPHASGALLLDWNGRAFGMVLSEDMPNIPLADLTTHKLRQIIWERNVFSGFPLRSGLQKIKADPPSVLAAQLIDNLAKRGASDVLLEELPLKIKSAMDSIHLIDALFTRGIWERSTAPESAHLIDMVHALAAAKCTHRYWADMLVRYLKPEIPNSDAPPKSADRTGVPTPRLEPPPRKQTPLPDLPNQTVPHRRSSLFSNLPEMVAQLNMTSPSTSREMGALLLDSARSASSDEPETASKYVRLALAFLRGAANSRVVRDAIAAGSSNQDYASLMANVAVAEDIGAQYGFGSKDAAEKAIYAAVVLGGAPTAYRLAARYAAAEASHDAALGLYARAAAMLSNQDPRERELRAEIVAEFDQVVAQTSVVHSVQIESFDFTQLAGKRHDRWTLLAANPRDWIEARLAEEQRGRALPRGTYALVTDLRLAYPEPGNWLMTRGNYKGWSYSALDQINSSNVKNLVPVWSFSTGVDSGHESPPIVNNGVMFVTTPYSQVIALDAATGDLLWRYKRPLPEGFSALHNTNRGVALYGDKVYFAPLDATVVALDAKTGKVAWEAKVEDWKQGYYTTMAPLIVKGKVLIGVAGGEFGVRGFVQAFDAQTGKSAWKTYTIPAPGEPGSDTWKKADTWKTGGASTWMTGNSDLDTNTVYWGTGNGSPWFGDQRPGDNLYTSSTVALDGDTGKIKGHFQYHQDEVLGTGTKRIRRCSSISRGTGPRPRNC